MLDLVALYIVLGIVSLVLDHVLAIGSTLLTSVMKVVVDLAGSKVKILDSVLHVALWPLNVLRHVLGHKK